MNRLHCLLEPSVLRYAFGYTAVSAAYPAQLQGRYPFAALYITHYPSALPAAALAAQIHGNCYAFDAEDSHLGDSPEDMHYGSQRALTRAIESAGSQGWPLSPPHHLELPLPMLPRTASPPPVVVRNMFLLSHAPGRPTSKGSATPGLSMYWFSQTIGPNRGL